MEFLDEWIILVLAFGVAVISPGPDFVIAIRNSIVHSRKAGLFTAIGFGLGVAVHVFYSIVGIAALIAKSVLLFTIIKFMGAGYLIYIGIKALQSKGFEMKPNDQMKRRRKEPMNALEALTSGFVTNLFNPKATMFFLALFTQILEPGTPVMVQTIFGLTCMIMCSAWFSIVALLLTNENIKGVFLSWAKWIDRISGGLLIALGVKLAVSKV